jgi:2-polyprenyl-3-methyl-5-hydroxy-6-metoxy-1,4-benzoquinol methylase
MDISGMNGTIDYYNSHANEYYRTTVDADLDAGRKKFAAYLPAGARVIDMGCGSGRDVLAFREMGLDAAGLDASEELVRLAKERLGIPVFKADLSCWTADEPYDGIWCCAALMHLEETDCRRFFANLKYNLKPGGALYISVKSGIETGMDSAGRYMRNFTEEDIYELAGSVEGLEITELWYSADTLSRNDFRWLNIIAVKHQQ